MYLHIGQHSVVRTQEIVGIFDLDNTTVSKITRGYLKECQDRGQIREVSEELPKSFVLTAPPSGRPEESRVLLSPLSTATLLKRSAR